MFETEINVVIQGLVSAIERHVAILNVEEAAGSIFGYVLYCDSGFSSFGVAVGRVPHDGCDVNGVSPLSIYWQKVNDHYELFDVSEFAYKEIVDPLESGALGPDSTGEDVSGALFSIFEKVILDVYADHRIKEALSGKVFMPDTLKGVQMADASARQVHFFIRISELLNSAFWHRRFVAGLEQEYGRHAVL